MSERMGQFGAVGLALESTWGQPVAAATYLEVTEADLRPLLHQEVAELVGGTRARRRAIGGSYLYSGPIAFPVCAGNLGPLLKAAFGTVTTTLVSSTASASVYQHTFTRAETTALPSLTIEQNLGGLTSKQVAGVRLNELRLSLRPGQSLAAEADCRGKEETLITPTSPSYPPDDFLHHSGFTAEIGGAAANEVESFELRFLNNLVDDLWTAGGSGQIGRLPAGTFAARGNYQAGFESTTAYQAFKAGSFTPLEFKLTGATIAGTWAYGLQLDLPRVRYFAADVPLVPRRLTYDIEFEGLLDTTQSPPCEARALLTNTTSGY
jgi:hypothetical protein